ncbi:type II toxin-antitoxin system PemK/MazF family toxin [Cellulomonas cellasea]|uniref:mRNA-degrading endonuclease toxin of MazEF toxin-antitoxin module n=1 Tax=Cellulomonas cellasea TaxID=43670 RepID=A0A7W4UF15_9CELL|nr:type II toxin-antitoxin system PemK/MazF family toxin [Cellulomonas cellasea]MBB2923010.1 mRNA-degrading endonuclease toxin of MazEF toxin-antitoxin module [Cellulomonas cellasea]
MPDPESSVAVLTAVLQERPWLAVVAVAALVAVLRLVRRPGRPVARPGEVWFARVPFEDGSGAKDRPVLVLSVGPRTCGVARITSQDKSTRADHVRVPPGTPGLARASWIGLRPLTLRRSALRRRTGEPGAGFLTWYRDAVAAADAPRARG